ncbi:MAG TPA: Rieske (2Fe-2S) protein [Micromonosporaceae bacterium]|nr:Rieske (2Fe-2S) protein [Micromonosporaceae bacterium]
MAGTTRRTVLMGVGAAGMSAAAAACGGEDSGSAEPSPEPSPSAAAPTSAVGGEPSGDVLAKLSDVPVGGGIVLAEQKVVLTRPAEAEIKAFSAVCTHRGCTLAEVKDGTINCGCHGSKFSSQDGAVRTGPATKPLSTVEVKVDGDRVFRV